MLPVRLPVNNRPLVKFLGESKIQLWVESVSAPNIPLVKGQLYPKIQTDADKVLNLGLQILRDFS